jgi:hypothetical protein
MQLIVHQRIKPRATSRLGGTRFANSVFRRFDVKLPISEELAFVA